MHVQSMLLKLCEYLDKHFSTEQGSGFSDFCFTKGGIFSLLNF